MKDGIPAEISDGTAVHDKAKLSVTKQYQYLDIIYFNFFYTTTTVYYNNTKYTKHGKSNSTYEAKVGKATL